MEVELVHAAEHYMVLVDYTAEIEHDGGFYGPVYAVRNIVTEVDEKYTNLLVDAIRYAESLSRALNEIRAEYGSEVH